MAAETTIDLKHENAEVAQAHATTQLSVEGMTCGNCARHVVEALQSVAGVQSATAAVDQQRASVRWGANATHNLTALVKAVEDAGFQAKVLETEVHESAHHKLVGWQANL